MKQIFIILFTLSSIFTYGQVRYEAEDFVDNNFSNGVRAETNSRYTNISNGEYVTGLTEPGDQIGFDIDIPTTGYYNITIRYASDSRQKNYIYTYSGQKSIEFPKAKQFTDKVVRLYMEDYYDSFAIAKQWGWINIDYIEVELDDTILEGDACLVDACKKTITIDVKGSCGTEVMEVKINNRLSLRTNDITKEMRSKQLKYSKGTINTVEIAFLNDGNDSGCDRNLFIDKISIDGSVFETETAATRKGCGNSEWLWCEGSFIFNNLNYKTQLDLSNSDTELQIYPNPLSTNSLNLNFSGLKEPTEVEVTIYSINGAEMYTKSVMSSGSIQLTDIPDLDSGVYIVRAVANNFQQHAKLNIQ